MKNQKKQRKEEAPENLPIENMEFLLNFNKVSRSTCENTENCL